MDVKLGLRMDFFLTAIWICLKRYTNINRQPEQTESRQIGRSKHMLTDRLTVTQIDTQRHRPYIQTADRYLGRHINTGSDRQQDRNQTSVFPGRMYANLIECTKCGSAGRDYWIYTRSATWHAWWRAFRNSSDTAVQFHDHDPISPIIAHTSRDYPTSNGRQLCIPSPWTRSRLDQRMKSVEGRARRRSFRLRIK